MERKEQRATGKALLEDVMILQKIDDDFDSFQEDLTELAQKHSHKNIVKSLERIKLRKKHPVSKDIIKFYHKHQSTFDTITLSTTITLFLNNFYNEDGSKKLYSPLFNFHEYFQAHPEERENAKELLSRMKDLKIECIEINPNIDFTSDQYTANKDELWNETLTYLENIEVLPNYNQNAITYRSTGSNYAIKLPFYVMFGGASKSDKDITVTNLAFDKDCLPERLHVETFFRTLKQQREEIDPSCKRVKDAVDLSIQELDMRDVLAQAQRIVDDMNPNDANESLLDGLKTIRDGLEAFGIGINIHNDAAIQEDEKITEKVLEGERNKQLTRINRKKAPHGNRGI